MTSREADAAPARGVATAAGRGLERTTSARGGPRRRTDRSRRRRGFALVAALAVPVVLAGFGAAMVRLAGLEQAGSSLHLLGARADWAARSGIDWALFEAAASGSCPTASWTLDEGALAGFQVSVSCMETEHREGSRTLRSLSIRSEAWRGTAGEPEFVYREVQAAVVL